MANSKEMKKKRNIAALRKPLYNTRQLQGILNTRREVTNPPGRENRSTRQIWEILAMKV